MCGRPVRFFELEDRTKFRETPSFCTLDLGLCSHNPCMRINTARERSSSLEADVYLAQRHSGSLSGLELRQAASMAANLSVAKGWHLLAADRSGERIIGAALVIEECLIADSSRRYDGKSILLVAGMIAGPFGITQASAIARSSGAENVHAMYLGGWAGDVPDCDSIWGPDTESSTNDESSEHNWNPQQHTQCQFIV
jgi:hypothetical protein